MILKISSRLPKSNWPVPMIYLSKSGESLLTGLGYRKVSIQCHPMTLKTGSKSTKNKIFSCPRSINERFEKSAYWCKKFCVYKLFSWQLKHSMSLFDLTIEIKVIET